MTSWHHVARHCSMCHHPDNETEWPHGTALLPDMVLCVIIQTMRLNDLMALPCCQACNKAWIPWPECLNQLNYQDSLNALTPWLSSQPVVYAWWIIVLTPLWGGWGVVMLGLTSSSMSHMWVGRLKRLLPVLVLWMFRMFSQLSGQENSTIVFRILLKVHH